MAARHQDRVAFQAITGEEANITINLDSIPAQQPWQAWPLTLIERRAVAGKLLRKFTFAQSLDFNTVSEGEMVNVLDAVIYANPSAVVQLATSKRAELEKRPQITGILIGQAIERNSSLAGALSTFMPTEYRYHLYLRLQKNPIVLRLVMSIWLKLSRTFASCKVTTRQLG